MQPLKKNASTGKAFFSLQPLENQKYFVLLQSLNEGFKKPMQV